MSKEKSEPSKYNIYIGQAQGPVVGGYAHVEQHFHAAPPPPLPASRKELLIAIQPASVEVRNCPNKLLGNTLIEQIYFLQTSIIPDNE